MRNMTVCVRARVNNRTKAKRLTPLLGHTDSLTATACSDSFSCVRIYRCLQVELTGCLGVLTTHTKAPEVPQTTVRPDLLQSLKIITQF